MIDRQQQKYVPLCSKYRNDEATIETQTDGDGWLWVENIPDGVELYTMFD